VVPFGAGCAGTFGIPLLAVTSAPSLGNAAFGLQLAQLVPHALGFLGLSFARAPQGLGPSCTLYLTSPASLLGSSANGNGVAGYTLPIPNNNALLGVRVFAQGAAVDASGSYLNQLSFSRGLDLMLGQ